MWQALWSFLLTSLSVTITTNFASAQVNSPHAKVTLVSSLSKAAPGETIRVGFYFEIEPEWHIYWKNPGDSGTPLRVEWELPSTLSVAPQKWPLPKRIPVGPLANYGYDGNVLIPFELLWSPSEEWSAADQSVSELKLTAKADWLICKVECLPADGVFELVLPIERSSGSELSASKHLFDRVKFPAVGALSDVRFRDLGVDYEISFGVPEGFSSSSIEWDFFSADELRIQHAAIPKLSSENDGRLQLTVPKDINAPNNLSTLDGLVMAQGKAENDRVGFEVSAKFFVNQSPTQPLWLLIIFAILGGLILNIMPCVFPVLSLKVLSFVHLAGESGGNRALKRHGLVFALGVLVSFWALAGLLIALRQSGLAIGWGFQLQSPIFVSALAILFFVIGLNFIGFFEINFSGGRLGSMGAKSQGYTSSFLSGILATVVATPCTAPFMGIALGAALALPPLSSVIIFSFLGLGMAAPYVVLSFNPKWLSALPRPGAWMETFRQFLSFPIFATALWLLWVMSSQNQEQVISLLTFALVVVFGLWLIRIGVKKFQALVLFSFVLLALVWLGRGLVKDLSIPNSTQTKSDANDYWQSFDPQSFDRALATSEYVFVDFTASWCITCQVNKKVVLNTQQAKEFFDSQSIAMVRADWTHQDPQITKLLGTLSRSSVPTYAIFRRDRKVFALLPEILTQQILDTHVQKFMKTFENNTGGNEL
jgi:thiol:disulfide interchange protein